MTLYINACPRNESRTDRLAKAVLSTLGDYVEIKPDLLEIQPLNNNRLDRRTSLIENGCFDDEMFSLSKQFADADTIVVAAPYWDGSFPAVLKVYFENIYVTGIVSEYDCNGRPHGLCKAEKLYYVTTAGGPYNPKYSYEYVEFLAKDMFGINETQLVAAEYLDICGNNPEEILEQRVSRFLSSNNL